MFIKAAIEILFRYVRHGQLYINSTCIRLCIFKHVKHTIAFFMYLHVNINIFVRVEDGRKGPPSLVTLTHWTSEQTMKDMACTLDMNYF